MAYSHNAPFRADVVGSYLRPAELKAAREDFAAGKIDAAALKAVEDKAITELVAKQKAAGLHVITDGEFRRGWWHFDFMWGFNGVDHAAAAHRVAFHDEVTPADTATVTGRISGENHPFVEHFKFVKQFEDENTVARQTMPSPAQTRFVLTGNAAAYPYDEFYKNDDELTADIVAAYRQVIADLYAAGCRNVQFDDCTWTRLCDASVRERLGWSDEDALRLQQENLDVINAVIADQPDDLVINTHVCRGNFHSTWLSSGGLRAGRGQTVRRGERGRLLPRASTTTVPAIRAARRVSGAQEGRARPDHLQEARPSRIRTPSRPASRKPPSTFRSTACACPPSAASPPPRKATSSPKTSSGPRSHSSNPSPRTCGASKHSTPSTISYKEGLSVLFGG